MKIKPKTPACIKVENLCSICTLVDADIEVLYFILLETLCIINNNSQFDLLIEKRFLAVYD